MVPGTTKWYKDKKITYKEVFFNNIIWIINGNYLSWQTASRCDNQNIVKSDKIWDIAEISFLAKGCVVLTSNKQW